MKTLPTFSSLELCAGAGGQALGLESAGFRHEAAFEIDEHAYQTLALNRPAWRPERADVRMVRGGKFKGIDLLAAGVPCPPFSVAGRQLGAKDERDLFPAVLEWIAEAKPNAVLLENVPGLASGRFEDYRKALLAQLRSLRFSFVDGQIVNAKDFGVAQLRPRYVIIALRPKFAESFEWPTTNGPPPLVGDLLFDLMGQRHWPGADKWRHRAAGVAPTIVGGSKLHGGPDLGPTRAKLAWRDLGVDGNGIADEAPGLDFPVSALPKLTVRMTARLQGFPDEWEFFGRKTAAYRQVGNAFPPPVAAAVGSSIAKALSGVSVQPIQGRFLAAAG